MIKEILTKIAQGNTTWNELVKALNLTHIEMSNRLETLESMGYIRTVCQGKTEDVKNCPGCPMNRTCSNLKSTKKDMIIKVYELTEKGKRACNTHE